MRKRKTVHTTVLFLSLATMLAGCSDDNLSHQNSADSSAESSRKAHAAVAIARAAFSIADEYPALPDTPPRRISTAPPEQTDDDYSDRPDTVMAPIQIEFHSGPLLNESLPAQLVVGHWAQGCPAGERQERDLRQTLTPLGWTVGSAATDQIQIVHVSHDQSCPQLTLYQNGSVTKSWTGYHDPTYLSHELRRAWDSSPSQVSQATAGSGGAIHARSQILAVLHWWKRNIGEGTEASIEWDRTGAQTFPLLARSDWSPTALFGKSGRIQVTAIGSALPIDSLGFAYRILDDDVSIDLDSIRLKGLVSKLDPKSTSMKARLEPLVSEFGPATVWTIITVIRDIFSLLNPVCDLQLGGNLLATANLSGETLAIKFQQPPSVKLVALFTFQLSVNRVEISSQSVRLLFGGSRLVKERTFLVK